MTTLNTATITQADIKSAATKDLLELYNFVTKQQLKRFADRKAAESRTWRAVHMLAMKHDIENKETNKRDISDNRIIQLQLKENPKRITSGAFKKFELLMKFDGKTVREYKNLEGKYPSLDVEKGWPSTVIRWSVNNGDIKLFAKK